MLLLPMAGEGIYFLLILHRPSELKNAELIVEFEGREGRAEAAYRLADCGYAPAMVISPADEKKLDAYDREYQPKIPFERILENKARTTFENALLTGEIINERGFDSVILVTSWDHMPRSYLLLRMMVGTNVQVCTHAVKRGDTSPEAWYSEGLAWKMIHNEMVETWGSLIEFASYHFKGSIPTSMIGKNSLFSGIKQLLLFDVDSENNASIHLIHDMGNSSNKFRVPNE